MAEERQFGPYRLIRQLATGGMAEIHLAKTKGIFGFEKFVAIKMIHPNFSADEHFVQMLIDEAKITVQLQHVNIAQVFDLGRVGDTFYITMEYIDGADLYRLLRRAAEQDIEVPLDVACFVVKEVCQGLDYAHKKRDASGRPLEIIHRDISPQNVILSTSAEVKVVDFGIAKAAMRSKQTAVGVIKGKYYYMSPEQAWAEPLDHRTDVFSAGILLYEMLIGQMLYLEEDVQRLLNMVRRADIPPPSTRRKGVPPALDTIVMKALAKRREQRYQSARDLGGDLERFLHAFSPEFTSAKVAAFFHKVMGLPPEPEILPQPPEDEPEDETRADHKPGKLSRQALMSRQEFTDENSVIFRMSELPGAPRQRGEASREARPTPSVEPPAPQGKARQGGQRPTAPLQAVKPANTVQRARTATGGPPLPPRATTPPPPPRPVTPRPASHPRANTPTPQIPYRDAEAAARASASFDDGETRLDPQRGVREEATVVTPFPRRPSELADDLAESTRVSPTPVPRSVPRGAPTALPAGGGGQRPEPVVDGEETRVERGLSQRQDGALDELPGAEPTRLDPLPLRPQTPAPGPRPNLMAVGDEDRPEETTESPFDAQPLDMPTIRRPDPLEIQSHIRDANVQAPAVSALVAPRPSRRTPAQGLPVAGGDQAPMAPPGLGTLLPERQPSPQAYANPYPDYDPSLNDVDVRNGRKAFLLWTLGVLVTVGIIVGVVMMVRSSRDDTAHASASIEIISIPLGAQVKVDGVALPGVTPLRYDAAAPGKSYNLSVELEHYEPWSRTEAVPAGSRQVKVIASLRPILGTLTVSSTPGGAEVFLNNHAVGRTPLTLDDVDPFVASRVEVRLRGHKPQVQEVSWSAQQTAELSFQLTPAQ